MKNFNKNVFLFFPAIMLLVSCGFHLRGEIKVPEIMREIQIIGNATSNHIGEVLDRRLKQLEIQKVNKEKATAILTITRNNFTRRVLTVDSGSKASAYKLDLIIGFKVTDKEEKVLVNSQEIRQTREYNIDPNNALASDDQEVQLKIEMAEFVVNQMLTRISFALKNTK